MLASKKETFKPILESYGGIHLSAYLVNFGDLVDLKFQIKEIIRQSYEHLSLAMTLKERNKFLEPFESLLLDASVLKEMRGNIGIFRKNNFFVIINITSEIEKSFQVASSFHVKPILKWLQDDHDFLLLGLEKNAAHLFLGDQNSFKIIDSVELPAKYEHEQNDVHKIFIDWISNVSKASYPTLFIAGEKEDIENFRKKFKLDKLFTETIECTFQEHVLLDICTSIRAKLKNQSENYIKKSISEYYFAEEENRACKNIFKISKAVIEGRVQKLIIAKDMHLFGTIDKKSGDLSLHPFDLDHEDDDVLDDLAQIVLSQGGEVVLASQSEIPKSCPVLAILNNQPLSLEKTKTLQFFNIHKNKQRFI